MRLRSLTIAFLSAFFVATVGTGVGVYLVTRATISSLVDQRIAAASRVVMGAPTSTAADMVRRIDMLSRDRDTGDIGFLLSDGAGRRLGGNIAPGRSFPTGFSNLRIDDRIKGLTEGRAYVRDVGQGLRLTTIAETEPFADYNKARVRIYLVGFGSIVLVVLTGVLAFGLTIRMRIAAMRGTVQAIIDGDMQHRVSTDGSGGEFDRQARAFNRMLDRIAELMAGISNVSSDVAHDLRTPLARLHSQLAVMVREADSAAMRASLEAALAQSEDLLAMFAAMLRITEVEGGDRRAAFVPIDLGQLVADVGSMMQPVAEQAGYVLGVGPCAAATILGDQRLLTQALINLIENGLRHTPTDTRITLTTYVDGTKAILIVQDNGPGIPPELRGKAMRRFGRLDPSRHGGGHGLGLPLVETIVRLHRGSLALEDAAPGLRVVVAVPLA